MLFSKAKVLDSIVKTFSVQTVQELVSTMNIPTSVEYAEVTPVWNGQPKVLKQVLWERGSIPEDTHGNYTISKTNSLLNPVYVMGTFYDFVDETTLLQDTLNQ